MVKRIASAIVWRWMKSPACAGACRIGCILRRHFDEIADDIVVPDLERLDAGLGRIVGLQPGDDLARVVAQPAVFVELRGIAFPHEAAVAGESGSSSCKRGVELRGRAAVGRLRERWRRMSSQPVGQCEARIAGAQYLGELRPLPRSPPRTAPRSRGPPRPSDRRAKARSRSGMARKSSRKASRKSRASTKMVDLIEPGVDRAAASASGLGEPLGEQAAARSGDGHVDRIEQAAALLAARVRVSSRLARVAASMSIAAFGSSRRGGRSNGARPTWVRTT